MCSNPNFNIISNLLQRMDEQGIPCSKVAIHKTLFFLKEFGIPLPMKFEPYTYGPYSFSLASDLKEMVFWNLLVEEDNHFSVAVPSKNNIPDEMSQRIDSLLKQFRTVIGSEITFNNLELVGTVLYCLRTLEFNGEKVDEKSLLKLFREWKNEKYHDSEILEMSKRLGSIVQ